MNTPLHHPLRLLAMAAALACGASAAWAVDVSSEADLRAAIFAINDGGADTTITLTADITLARSLPMITRSLTVAGGGHAIDAAHTGRVFFVQGGTAGIGNLTIANALAQGGKGGDGGSGSSVADGAGGGGGLGAGAAVFVNGGATVFLSGVVVGSAAAVGGAGGSVQAVPGGVTTGVGGGGGLGGNGGGGGSGGAFAGGGGGYAGAGGIGTYFSGGGGGEFGNGGNGSMVPMQVGGGGGGRTVNGGAGSAGGPEGGAPGGGAGGFSGGGGNGFNSTGGGGGVGGGGGGAMNGNGGPGGDFGGGGGAFNQVGLIGGAGGFGGGGGGAAAGAAGAGNGTGGAGGFGAGGGGGATAGLGGSHGGNGGVGTGVFNTGAGGGGGAALGGAVFVAPGGTLTMDASTRFTGSYGVTAGAGGSGGDGSASTDDGQPGQALGTVMFLAHDGVDPSVTTLSVADGTTESLGAGALAGTGTLWKAGTGTLEINGANPGFTGTLGINAGILSGTGSLGGRVEASPTARLAPGSGGAGTLGVGHLTFALNGGLDLDLGTASDLVEVEGDLTMNGGATINVTAGPGFGPGTYKVITYGGVRSGAFTVGTKPAGYTVAVSTATAGEIRLEVQAITYPVTVTPGAGGTATCTPNPVAHGDDTACTATPGAGYTFAGWGGECAGTGACTFTNVTGAHAVTAAFAPIVSYTGPLPSGGGPATATVASPSGTCVFTHAQFMPPAFVAAAPPAQVNLVADLFDFELQGCTPGEEATITLTYPPGTLPAGAQYWKYGPRPGPLAASWYHFPSPNATVSGNTVTLRITDGALGDDDLDATNGRIVDAGGPALVAAAPAAIPTLSQWGVLLLSGLLGLAALRRRI